MLIKVRVQTDCKQEKIERISEDTISICVREPAEQNMANDRVIEIMRNLYRNKFVRLIHGHHSTHKTVEIG